MLLEKKSTKIMQKINLSLEDPFRHLLTLNTLLRKKIGNSQCILLVEELEHTHL
jgi:hypothetical protein